MEYFRLSQDKRMPYAVTLSGIDKIEGYFESKQGDMSLLENGISEVISHSPLNFYPDILDRQIYMVKGVVKEVFDMFLPGMIYKRCNLIDRVVERYETYYIPIIDAIKFKGGIERGRHIFRREDSKEIEVVVSLAVVEAILRRKSVGVRVEVVKNDSLAKEQPM